MNYIKNNIFKNFYFNKYYDAIFKNRKTLFEKW